VAVKVLVVLVLHVRCSVVFCKSHLKAVVVWVVVPVPFGI